MRCEFCQNRKARLFIPTRRWGRRHLCEPCYTKHGGPKRAVAQPKFQAKTRHYKLEEAG